MVPKVNLKQCISLPWKIHECLLWNLAETFLSSLQMTQPPAGTKLKQVSYQEQCDSKGGGQSIPFLKAGRIRLARGTALYKEHGLQGTTRHFVKLLVTATLAGQPAVCHSVFKTGKTKIDSFRIYPSSPPFVISGPCLDEQKRIAFTSSPLSRWKRVNPVEIKTSFTATSLLHYLTTFWRNMFHLFLVA